MFHLVDSLLCIRLVRYLLHVPLFISPWATPSSLYQPLQMHSRSTAQHLMMTSSNISPRYMLIVTAPCTWGRLAGETMQAFLRALSMGQNGTLQQVSEICYGQYQYCCSYSNKMYIFIIIAIPIIIIIIFICGHILKTPSVFNFA